MFDPRFQELAQLLVSHSIALQSGEKVLIELFDTPDEIGIALIRAIRAQGGLPFLRVHHGRLSRELSIAATDAQYQLLATHLLAEMQDMDAYIAIRGSHNIAENSDVSPETNKIIMKHLRAVFDQRVNQTKWCVLRWPSPAMAQQAGMSTEAFEEFYFKACLLDWKKIDHGIQALKSLMNNAREVKIVGNGTDLRFSIAGIPAIECAGNYNIPDGEVFTAPVKDSVEGVIQYNAPSIYRGIPFDGVRLVFEKGRIIEAVASSVSQTKALNDILDSDEGARYIGEFAIGFHPHIHEPMRDILFDEKIAGSFHFTPGQAYENADNGNRSQVHWDLVCIQRADYGGGEIYFDGELIRKDGKFLSDSLACLNWE